MPASNYREAPLDFPRVANPHWFVTDVGSDEVLAVLAANAGAAGDGSFVVSGDRRDELATHWAIEIGSSTGNDGVYTIRTGVAYDESTEQTTIPVVEEVPDATADGRLRWWYPSPQESSHVFPARRASNVVLPTTITSTDPITFDRGSEKTLVRSLAAFLEPGSLVRAHDQGGFQAIESAAQRFVYFGTARTANIATHGKLDSLTGKIIWLADRGAVCRAIAVDDDGNVYTGGLRTAGHSLERWDPDGNLDWQQDAGDEVYAVAVAGGVVYAGTDVNNTGFSIQKYEAETGNVFGGGNWPINNGVGRRTIALAVDPFDGRVGAGYLNMGGMAVKMYDEEGNELTLTPPHSFASHQRVVAFDWKGHFYSVGDKASSVVGYEFRADRTFRRNFTWRHGSAAKAMAVDRFGRILIGGTLNPATGQIDIPAFTAYDLNPAINSNVELWDAQISRHLNALAVDRGGNAYLATTDQVPSASVWKVSPLGAVLWGQTTLLNSLGILCIAVR